MCVFVYFQTIRQCLNQYTMPMCLCVHVCIVPLFNIKFYWNRTWQKKTYTRHVCINGICLCRKIFVYNWGNVTRRARERITTLPHRSAEYSLQQTPRKWKRETVFLRFVYTLSFSSSFLSLSPTSAQSLYGHILYRGSIYDMKQKL